MRREAAIEAIQLPAIPAAAAILLLAYVQAASGLIPLKHDPLARLLGVGVGRMADDVAALQARTGAKAILTGDYETTAWLSFYRPTLAVIAVVLTVTTIASLIRIRREPTARAHAGAVIGTPPKARPPEQDSSGDGHKTGLPPG